MAPKEGSAIEQAAIFHDYFGISGGGERLALALAKGFASTLVYGFRTNQSYADSAFPKNTKSLKVNKVFRRSSLRQFLLARKFRAKRNWAARFPVRIFSGVSAPFAAPEDEGVNIYYCHTPPRFLYDQRTFFLEQQSALKRLIAPLAMSWYEKGYQSAAGRMNIIVTNSKNTQDRIRHYLGRESIVVHPPVDTDHFRWKGQGDYYLSNARLTPLKRVDQIVKAFQAMPDKKLIVASGGEELERLKLLARGAQNIEFRGWVSDEEMYDLVGNAIATIYVPIDEDFGMSPVESMAAGKPVIGVAEGGLLETVLPDETGVLIRPSFTPDVLSEAIESMDAEKALSMRTACEKRAQEFSKEKFIKSMRSIISQTLQQAVGTD